MSIYHKLIFRFRYNFFYFSPVRRIKWNILGAHIGKNTKISNVFMSWPHQVHIGNNCTIEHNIFFKFDGIFMPSPSITIGNNSFIGATTEFNIRSRCTLGSNCLIGSNCKFIDHDHNIEGIDTFKNMDGKTGNIAVSNHVWIGSNSTILRSVNIGQGAVIGAGSIVTKNIPPNEIWAGVPARKIGERKPNSTNPACAS